MATATLNLLLCFCFVGFAAGAFADSQFIKTCAPAKCPDGDKFAYEPGYSYIYNYEANIVTTISGDTEDFTSIYIEAQTEIHAFTSCEFSIKLRNVNLRNRDVDNPVPSEFAPGHQQFKEALEKWTLRFSFEDGAINMLCAEPAEEKWVLNIKRAIISTMQNRANANAVDRTRVMERDVQGNCPTEYILDFHMMTMSSKKSKDLDKCSERSVLLSAIQSSPYISPKIGQTNSILRSTYKCIQDFDERVISRVSCDERHILRPFSSGDSGAMTMTKQSLVLMDEIHRPVMHREAGSADFLTKTTLLFDHDYGHQLVKTPNVKNALQEAEMALSQLCRESKEDIRAATPHHFWRLVKSLQLLSYSQLWDVMKNADRTCEYSNKGRKYFHDALPLIGNPPSINLIKDLIMEGSLHESETNSWLEQLAFHPQPTKQTIAAIMPLLTSTQQTTGRHKVMLSIAALINSYCQNNENCEETSDVRTLNALLMQHLGNNCVPRNPGEMEKIVVALKALGNLGRWTSPDLLEKCSTSDRPTAVRLASINAYRKLSCNVQRKHLLRIFSNTVEDSEIRIAAYLGVMRCPEHGNFDSIWESLKSEAINQVNSFVWSHLSSIKKSADPCKMEIRVILEDAELQTKYTQDIRRFSKAFEKSIFSETLNAGGHLEAHLVYSSSSFIPRSAMVNLTLDLFGQSINLMEINGRVEGFDYLAETFFRQEPHSEVRVDSNGNSGNLQHFPADTRIQQITKTVKSSMKTLSSPPPDGSLSMKVFGQEVWYNHASSDQIESLVQRWSHGTYADFLKYLAKDNSVEISKNTILMDTSFVVPTLAGLPLSLSLNATANAHLKLGGRLDIQKFPQGIFDIDGQLRPSAGISLMGSMTVDGYVGKSGVNIDADLHTSTQLDGKFVVNDRGHVKVHFNLLKDRMDFLQAKSNLVLNHWGKARTLRSTPSDSTDSTHCSTAATSKPLGVEFCAKFRYPNASRRSNSPSFPLTGPSHIAFWVKKTDMMLNTYHFEYVRNRGHSVDSNYPNPRSFILSFRTPRSTVDREWTVDYRDNPANKSMHLSLLSPYKKIIIKGSYGNDATRKGLYADVMVDRDQEFSFHSEIGIEHKIDHIKYLPKIIIRVPSRVIFSLEGFFHYSESRYLTADITIQDFTIKPIILRGELIKESKESGNIHYNGMINSPMLDANIKGSLNLTTVGVISKMNFEYHLVNQSKKETVDLTMKMKYTTPSSRSLTIASATIDIHTSILPEYNSIVIWNFQIADGHVENTVQVDSTRNGRKAQLAHLQQILTYRGTLEEHILNGTFLVKIPSKNVHFVLAIDHKNEVRRLLSKIYLQRSLHSKYGLELHVQDDSDLLWCVNGHALVYVNGEKNGIAIDVTEKVPREYLAHLVCMNRPFGNVDVFLNYKNHNSDKAVNQGLWLNVTGDVEFSSDGSIFAMDDQGRLKVDWVFKGDQHQLEGDYKQLKSKEYEGEFSFQNPAYDINGIVKLNVGKEKVLDFDVRSASGRRIIGGGRVKSFYDISEFSSALSWDAGRDPTQRIVFAVIDERRIQFGHTTFRFIYLNRTIGIEFQNMHNGSLFSETYEQDTFVLVEWEGAKKLGVDLDVNVTSVRGRRQVISGLDVLTPLSAIDSLVVNVSHQDDGLSWVSIGSMVVNKRLPFHAVSQGKYWRSGNQQYLEAVMNVTTPIEGFETIVVNLEHDLASREIESILKVQWAADQQVVLRAYAIKPNTKYDKASIQLNVTTPFATFQSLNFGVDHDFKPGQVNSLVRLLWNNQQKVFVLLKGDSGMRRRAYETKGYLILITPLDGFDNFTISLMHSHDVHGFRTNLRGILPSGNLVSLGGEGTLRNTEHSVLLNGSFDVISSLIRFGTGLSYARVGREIKGTLRGNWNDTFTNISAAGAYVSMTDFGLDITLITPVKGLENATLIVMNRIFANSVMTKLSGKCGESESGLSLDGQWNFDQRQSRNLDVLFRLDSPLAVLPHIHLNATHGRTGSSLFRTNVEGAWDELKVYLDHSLTLHNKLNFEDNLTLSLPFDSLEHVQLTVNQSWEHNFLKNELELQVLHDKLLRTSVDVKHSTMGDGKRKIDASLKMDSTIWMPNQMEVVLDHVDNGIEYHPKIVFQTIPKAKASKSKVLQLTGYLRNFPGSKIWHLTANTQIPNYEQMALAGMYRILDTSLNFNLSTQWSGASKLEIDGEVGIDFLAPRLRLDIATPKEGYRSFKLDGHYNVWAPEKHASFFVQKEAWKLNLASSGTFEQDSFVAGLVIETPTSVIGAINLNTSGAWRKSGTRGMKVTLTWDNKKTIAIAIGLQPPKNSETTITASVITPLQWLRNVDGVIKISKEPSSHLIFEISGRWNRVDIVDATFYMGQDPRVILDLVISLKSTTQSMPHIAVVLFAKSATNLRNATASIEYIYRGKNLKIQTELKTQGRRTDALVHLETPFPEFTKGSLSINIRQKKSNNYDVSAVLQLPFVGMERITAEGAVKSLRSSVSRGDLRVSTPAQSLALNVQYETNSTGFTIRAVANPAITQWDLTSLDVGYQAGMQDIYTAFGAATTKSGRHEVSGKLHRQPSEIQLSGQALSPLLGDTGPLDAKLHILVRQSLAITTNLTVKEAGVVKHWLALDLAAMEPVLGYFTFAGSTPLLSNGTLYNVTVDVSETSTGFRAASYLVLPSGHYFAKTAYDRDASSGLIAFLIDAGSPIKELKQLKIQAQKTGDEWDNVAVHLDILSPIEGYERFGTTMATKHVLGSFFDFSMYIDTPFEGYEKINFEELLTYTLNLTSVSSGSNFTFDGIVTNLDFWYSKMGVDMDAGVSAKWLPTSAADGSDAAMAKDGGQFGSTFNCLGPAESSRHCVVDVLLKGTLWEGEGRWNYSGWRIFQGKMFIDTPFDNVKKVGLEAANNVPLGKGTVDSYVILHWAGKRVADLKVRGTVMENGKKHGSFNFTTPFSLVQQVDGQARVLRDESGIIGSFDVYVNKQSLLNGHAKLFSLVMDAWNNRTIAIELENPWQPFGLAVLSRRHSDMLSVDSSLMWDLTKRQENSIEAIIDIFYKDSGREIHASVVHPKHRVNLVTMYQNLPLNFTHTATLGWGKEKSTLAAYKIWLHTRQQGKSVVRKDSGFRWEHPGRVILCVADIMRKPRFSQMTMDVKWDASNNQDKHIRINMDYEDTSNQLGKSHKVKIALHHPKLSQDVEMTSDVMLGHGSDLFKGRLNLQYSPQPRDKLFVNTVLRGSNSNEGFTLTFNAKHAVSKLNVELSSDWQKTAKFMMTNTTFVFLNKLGQLVKFSLEGLGDFVNENGTLQVVSPKSRFVLALHHPDQNNYTLSILNGLHGKLKHASKVYYRPNNHYIEANGTSWKGEGDAIRFVAGFKSLRKYAFQILHGIGNEEIRDISIIFNLNTTHFMTARAYWVPDIADRVKVAVGEVLSNTHNKTITSLWGLWDLCLDESLDKFRLGWESFASAVQPMLAELKNETDAVMKDFKNISEYITEMYYNNDLLLQDIMLFLETGNGYLSELYEFLSELFHWNLEVIYSYIASAWGVLQNAWNSALSISTSLSNSWVIQIWEGTLRSFLLASDLVYQLWEKTGTAISAFPEIIANMVAKFQSSGTSIMSHFTKLSAVGEKIKAIWEKIKTTFADIKLWIEEKVIGAFISWIANSDFYMFLRAEIIQRTNDIIHFIRYRFLELLSKFVESVKLYMSDKQKQMMDDLMVTLFNIRDVVWSLPSVVQHPVVQNSMEILLSLHAKVNWIIQYYELSYPDGITTILKWYNDVSNLFTQTAEEASDHFDSPNYVLFLTENGVIEMDQQLPFPWRSLRESPRIQEMKEIKKLYELSKLVKSQEMPVPYNAYGPPIMAWYAKMSKTFNYKTWFPPFEGQAILAGRQHYVTLDGRVIEFAGACSYILMHDFMDGNFTITVNYDNYAVGRPAKRSISLRMDGKEIDIHPNFQVFVNGKKVELPHSFGDTSIIREADKTVVRNGYGIAVTCHWPYDVCIFKVSGWYFGRLAGMLGTYSYEQADDIVTPDGRIQQGASAHWANSWTAKHTGQCHTAQNFAVDPPRKDPIADGQCLRLFNDSFSLFQYCYEKVEPTPFLNMCLSDVRTRDTPEDVCTSAATYVQACNANDVSIRMPKLCVKCNLPDGQILQEAGNITMNSTIKLADVVFIIEAKKCNKDIVNVFSDLVNNIDSAMQMANIGERRYATVVFGGSGVYDEPHTLTSDSKIFTNQRTVSSLGNFNIGRGVRDFFDALRFATKLPFRPGASKNFVVLTCSVGESVEMRRDYPEVHRMLLEDGITVHLLLDREFEVKRPELLFYGIDGVNAYTSKDSRTTLTGDPDLRRQVMPPKDICVPIVLESNGTVFSSLRLYEKSKKAAKSFLDVYSRRVAQSAQVQVCQTCDCVPDADGVGRTYCQPCVFPRPSHFYMDPHNFFETQYISIYQQLEDGYKDLDLEESIDIPGDADDQVKPRKAMRNLTRRPTS